MSIEHTNWVIWHFGGLNMSEVDEHDLLKGLSERLKAEQRALLLAAAKNGDLPAQSTLQRVAQLELNIAAIENTLTDKA